MPSLGPFGGGRGLQGVQGEIGFPGLTGGRGIAGAAGNEGPQGVGLPGITGATGATGPAGSGGFLQASRVSRLAGNVTSTSASFVDLTGMTTTITTGAHRCDVRFTGACWSTATTNLAVDLAIDGTRVSGGAYGLFTLDPTAGREGNASFSYLTDVLSAGSHTFTIQWKVDAGTGMFYATPSICPIILTVLETSLSV